MWITFQIALFGSFHTIIMACFIRRFEFNVFIESGQRLYIAPADADCLVVKLVAVGQPAMPRDFLQSIAIRVEIARGLDIPPRSQYLEPPHILGRLHDHFHVLGGAQVLEVLLPHRFAAVAFLQPRGTEVERHRLRHARRQRQGVGIVVGGLFHRIDGDVPGFFLRHLHERAAFRVEQVAAHMPAPVHGCGDAGSGNGGGEQGDFQWCAHVDSRVAGMGWVIARAGPRPHAAAAG
ncbi:MAG: hypothetical protein DI635_12450 [Pseudoxanthomonas suwonensis]|nr:MAG: hypothetical protein DI635_12450 [Pseudoxanthomonas suwonensis]